MFSVLSSQVKVVFALILREARVRHGRSRLGYTWAVAEPALIISILTIIFNEFQMAVAPGRNFAVFFATGVLPFYLFRSTSQYVGMSLDANRPLFNYPMVKQIDAIFARAILEICTILAVSFLVFGWILTLTNAPGPHDIPKLVQVVLVLSMLATGAGLCLAVLRKIIPSINNLYSVLMGPGFLVSGVFFSPNSLPERARELLMWNPILHCIEWFRVGYFGGYRTPSEGLVYPVYFAATLLSLGLIGYWLTRRWLP